MRARRRGAAIAPARRGAERVDADVGARDTTTSRRRRRWRRAPLTKRPVSDPRDLDVVECQDTDAARELLSYEELGLVRAGRFCGDCSSGATPLSGAGYL